MLFLLSSISDDVHVQKKLEKIYYKYRKQMLFVAKNILHNDADAEDAVHDVFTCIAIRHMAIVRSIEKPEDLRNYLLKATKNTALNALKKKRRKELPLEEMLETEKEYSELSDASFVDLLCQKAEYDRVIAAMRQLKEPYRDILYYHFVLELSVPEAARQLNRSVLTAKKQLHRGKKQLLSLLEIEGDDL